MENRENEKTRSTRTTRSATRRERRLSSVEQHGDNNDESAENDSGGDSTCASFATPNLTEFTNAQCPPPKAQLFQTCDSLWNGNKNNAAAVVDDIDAMGKQLRQKLHEASQRILETKSSARTLPMSMRLRKGDGTACAVGGGRNFFARTRAMDRMHQRQKAIEKIKQFLDFVTDQDLQYFQRLSEQVHQVDITTQYSCATCHKCYKNNRGLAYHLERCRGTDGQTTREEEEEEEEEDPNAIIRCICARPSDANGSMVQCDRCEIWLHLDCIGQSEDALDEQYFCPRCAGQYRSPSPSLHSGGGKSVALLIQARNLELAKSHTKVQFKKHPSTRSNKTQRSRARYPPPPSNGLTRKTLANWRHEAVRKDQLLQQKTLQRVLNLSRSMSRSSMDADSDFADDDDNMSYMSGQGDEDWQINQFLDDARTSFVSGSWSDETPSLLFDQDSLGSSPMDEEPGLDLSTSSSQMVTQLPSDCHAVEHLFDMDATSMDDQTIRISGEWTGSENAIIPPYLFPHQHHLKLSENVFETYSTFHSTQHEEAIDLWLSTGGGGADVVTGVDMDQELDGLVDLDI